MTRRERAAAVLSGSGLGSLLRRLGRWRGVLTLAYHRIGDGRRSELDRSAFSATADGFEAQLRLLARDAEVIGIDDVRAGDRRPGRRVLITFDDGYRDAYEVAFPLLRAHALPATFFVSTGFLDAPAVPWWDEIAWMVHRTPRPELPAGGWLPRPVPIDLPDGHRAVKALCDVYKALPGSRTEAYLDHLAAVAATGRAPAAAGADLWMTWDMVRAMLAGGMAVGGHTVHHPVLARLGPAEQDREIRLCGQRLAAETGRPMRWFSYPVGRRDSFDAATRACLRARGVELAFSLYGARAGDGRADPLDLPRTSIVPSTTPVTFAALLTLPGRFARW